MPKLGYRRTTFEERFWSKVKKSEEPDGCWLWIASKRSTGYGQISCPGGTGNPLIASRASWEMHFGAIAKGKFVCHKCDTPLCVRPDHLWLGTAKDNAQDMAAKGRSTKGERSASYKITPEIAAAIRAAAGSYSQIAKQFNIAVMSAWRVRKFKQGPS
jgi:hypothetical protein